MRTYGCRYAAPLYVDITKRVVTRAPEAAEEEQQDELEEYPKVFIGEVRLKGCCRLMCKLWLLCAL